MTTGFHAGTTPPPPPGGMRILVADDHADTLSFMAMYLRGAGHAVTTADTTADAYDAFVNGAFDCVVSDLHFPDGTGADLVRRLHAVRPVPAIAVTGSGTRHDNAAALTAGFDQLLVKPVDLAALTRALDALVPAGARGA
jgi:DNA-binding response OmpR family regulator